MNERQLSYQDLLEIIKIVEESDKFTSFRLCYDGIEIEMNRGPGNAAISAVPPAAHEFAAGAAPGPVTQAAPLAGTGLPAGPKTEPKLAEGMVVIRAPMVGTFYRAPEPGAEPFVQVGATVDAHDTVCIIEVMKLMSALSADTAGIVREILVADGETVEYGQPLIVIEPSC